MRLRLILPLLLALSAGAHAAPPSPTSPVGRWWTEDRDGVIDIAPCGQGLCGRIIGENQPHDANGKSSMSDQGATYCGLTILRLTKKPNSNRWFGTITNPDNNTVWQCEVWVGDDGFVHLRGYVLLTLLGQTQVWQPFHGSLAADCVIKSAG